jgi:diguanylate cyclase (GGDEF)-like protein
MTAMIHADETSTPEFNEKQEVARLLDKRTFLPRFSPPLERLFLIAYAHRQRARMRVTLAIGLLVFLVAGIADLRLDPAVRSTLWLLRYMFIAPFIAASLGAALWARRDAALQTVYALALLAAGTGAAFALFLYPHAAVYGYALNLLVVLFYIYVISGMRISYGLPCALLVTGAFLAAAFLGRLTDSTVNMLVAQLTVVNIVGIYAAYRLEKESRRSFLHGRMVRLLSNEIVELAGVDELTGLANRRRMDEFFANTWARAQRDKVELTLLLLDVDYLQLLNGHLGRHIGDICLRKLGAVLQHYRRRPGDLAAYQENGKFLVILYGCGERHGRTIAERLRHDIESLNLMNPASPSGWTVTVSIGAHTVIPSRNQSSASGMLAAETLLYLAKNRGRNCVVSDKDAASGDRVAVEEKASRLDRTLVLPRSEAVGLM